MRLSWECGEGRCGEAGFNQDAAGFRPSEPASYERVSSQALEAIKQKWESQEAGRPWP